MNVIKLNPLKKSNLVKTILCTTIASIVFSGCTKKEDVIRVGEYGSMTGAQANFGTSTHEGIELALEEINAKGGIKGKKVKLISYDDQGKADEAAAAVTRLITQDGVVAILGEVASSISLAAAPIAQQNKVPMISPSSTNPKVTEVGDYIFRICFIDPFQGTVMAKFATETLKLKKVAVFRDIKSDYSMGLADYFSAKFKELGGQVVIDVSYQQGDNDFKAQLTQIKAAKPDGIFIPGYYKEVGNIAIQAKQLGLSVPLMGGDGWTGEDLFKIAGDAIVGNYFSDHYAPESTDPATVEFLAKYKAKYNKMPISLAAQGYDAMKILAAAMERAKDLSPTSIKEEIAKTANFPGATGVITLNEKRDAVKSAAVVQVSGATNKFITTINP